MPQGVICFADNNRDFLGARREFLEKAGYQVFTASTPEEASTPLASQHFDVAVLDIRLRNDADGRDQSGLLVARTVAPSVPKIMLTEFSDADVVRETYSPLQEGGAAATAFVSKQEGPEALLHAIQAVIRRNVFIVHGHDDAARDAAALFVHECGLRPIILREQAGAGRAIIQKFQDYTNVGFAIVLLTPDDVGEARVKQNALQPRARQNVIFELGYFIGKLGLHHVCALHTGGVEFPSDYLGVTYIGLDGDWRRELAREMRAAGLHIAEH